ncbi:hypothetical protein AGR2A_pb10093 [Agrobacterium genomosp. 2 str. CFBP 5494]|uniref:Uncharacterized protein n=1 Tax=Agrobacterium genomosp. 2 str. CFBP 5494 TaxID=1183436 RepID=A0A9W5B830_9HYPH|nr:hypothetical protein AGR2A_pb10093 [Agrobacterium genomosp. 2 str. CFBP 5494]
MSTWSSILAAYLDSSLLLPLLEAI